MYCNLHANFILRTIIIVFILHLTKVKYRFVRYTVKPVTVSNLTLNACKIYQIIDSKVVGLQSDS